MTDTVYVHACYIIFTHKNTSCSHLRILVMVTVHLLTEDYLKIKKVQCALSTFAENREAALRFFLCYFLQVAMYPESFSFDCELMLLSNFHSCGSRNIIHYKLQ